MWVSDRLVSEICVKGVSIMSMLGGCRLFLHLQVPGLLIQAIDTFEERILLPVSARSITL